MYGLCYTHYMRQCDTCGGDGSPEAPCTNPLLAVSSACQGESDGVHCLKGGPLSTWVGRQAATPCIDADHCWQSAAPAMVRTLLCFMVERV